MKAASIAQRIADFLKNYPPFEYLPEDALAALAAQGRVKFHEAGEIVFLHGQPRDRYIYVIKQGRVRIVDEQHDKELVDLRGEGDLLGLMGLSGEIHYVHTGYSEAETILYGLPREEFSRLCERSSQARRYLAIYFTLNPLPITSGSSGTNPPWVTQAATAGNVRMTSVGPLATVTLRKGGLFEVERSQQTAQAMLCTVPPETPVRQIAKLLRRNHLECVVIVDAAGHAMGGISDADLRDRLAHGECNPDAPAHTVMRRRLVACSPRDNTGQILIKLTQSGHPYLVVTQDGTLQAPVIGLITERNLFLQYGRFPTVLGQAIDTSPDVLTLRAMRDRLEALILEFMEDRMAFPWLLEMTGVLNRRLNRRLVKLCLQQMKAEGYEKPAERYSWLMMGSGGRDELLIRSAVYHALIYEDPPPERATEVRAFYRELARRVSDGLRQCGFRESPQGVLADRPEWCQPLSAMQARFAAMIAHPVEQNVFNARDAFDFRPLVQGCSLAKALRESMIRNLRDNPGFIYHMASDSLLHQPPRTIFQGYAVDERGTIREELEIKAHALLPLVDTARVLALEAGHVESNATYRRFQMVADILFPDDPEAQRQLNEASEAFLVSHYARVSRGLAAGTDGAVIRPASLDRETRELLKTAFRTILDTLEFTANRYGLKLKS
ncbi:MAG: DUF294 nucleotidyltransferase-like domain-containing protein [Verrucomicrobiota bacterium JB022]|nr:DUF294 nucleotidyltransferase-like domain-containing protein [Verrucomicrobiota bacterium JB022]